MNRLTRRLAACIACFAMLFVALAPSISHALSVSRGETWSEMCSSSGAKFVKVSADGDEIADPAAQEPAHLKHCAACVTHSASFVLPLAQRTAIPLADTQDARPFLFLHAPRPLAIWTVAQSRAPPQSA